MNTLETERLIIRPFVMQDLAAAHQLLDVDIQWSGPSFSLDQRRQRLQFYISLAQWGDTGCIYGYRAITLKPNSLLIGICGFTPVLWQAQLKARLWPELFGEMKDDPYASLELDIGYALGSQHRGQGYATEAVKALVDYAFRALTVHWIFAGTERSNTGSIRMMQHIGMQVASNPDQPELDWPHGPGVAGVLENRLC